jgi:uncharacterized membrane-anchored protein
MYTQPLARKNTFYLSAILYALFLFLFSAISHAQDTDAGQELKSAIDALKTAAMPGPQDIALSSQANLKLPEGFAFVPKAQADRFMRAIGNSVDQDFIGLIFGEELDGFVSIEFSPAGYIKDDDAEKWNVAELLNGLKEGTRQANTERTKRGIPGLEVLGWIEEPDYDASNHRLVWSVSARNEGQSAEAAQSVNYNTYLLGREGYLSLNLVTDSQNVALGKPQANALLAAVSFNDGKRYDDFDAATDPVAKYGLAALIGGFAAKKLGLLAAFGVFFVKFWKLLAIGLIAFVALSKKSFRRRRA